ncbi:putative TPR repeat-containing protein [Gammaproteobacteria bacterium]
MAINELGSFLSKKSYYFGIALGKDIETQIYLVSQATKELLTTQAAFADESVASKGRIADGLDYLSSSMDDVREGVFGLKSAFEIGISEVVWQIEKRKRELQDILKISMLYLDSQNKERRKRAENSYLNGLIDVAEEEFLFFEELNGLDFTIHINLAMIYMFHKVDIEKSIEYFNKAIECIRQRSPYYTSFSLIHKAILLREANLIEDARTCLEEAVRLSPNFCEALYQLTITELATDKDKAMSFIFKLLEMDIRYALKIEDEPAFITIKEDLHTRYRTIVNSRTPEIRSHHDDLLTRMISISEQVTKCNLIVENEDFKLNEELQLDTVLQRIVELVDRESLLDIYTADLILNDEATPLSAELKESAHYYVGSRVKHFEFEKTKLNEKRKKENENSLIYAMSKGIRVPIAYSLIYIVAFFHFRDILISILLATIPFIFIFSISEQRKALHTNQMNAIDEKLNKLIEVKGMMP